MTRLTLAGLALALAVLIANLRPWWKSNREPKQLVPFGSGFGIGALATMCPGGILGWTAARAAQTANLGGDKGVHGVTGQTTTQGVTTGSLGNLAAGGAVVVALAAFLAFLTWRAYGKQDRKRMIGGGFCGSTLSLTAGVAGLLAFLPQVVNQLGEVLISGVQGANVL